MISYETYKILHLIGLVLLFLGVGAAVQRCAAGTPDAPGKGLSAAAHGVGLLILLVAGFGLLARLKIGWPMWVYGKLVIWLLLGASLFLAKKIKNAAALVILFAALGGAAAWLAITKPM